MRIDMTAYDVTASMATSMIGITTTNTTAAKMKTTNTIGSIAMTKSTSSVASTSMLASASVMVAVKVVAVMPAIAAMIARKNLKESGFDV